MDVKKLEKSILLVDDHLIVRKGVELVLLAAMPKVTIYNAENYKEAIEIVNTIKLDLIILDININGVENIKIMNEIKAIYENVKILIFSSYDEKHNDLQSKENTLSLAIDDRQVVFQNIQKFCTQIINFLSSTNVSTKTIEDANSINAKIQGVRINKKAKSTTTEVADTTEITPIKTISVSHLSYDNIYDNFKNLIDLLSKDNSYSSEDDQFKIVNLQTKRDSMLSANDNVKTIENEVNNTRKERDQIFYIGEASMLVVAKGIKKYFSGKYGVTSPEFAQIKGIAFKDMSKKKKSKK